MILIRVHITDKRFVYGLVREDATTKGGNGVFGFQLYFGQNSALLKGSAIFYCKYGHS